MTRWLQCKDAVVLNAVNSYLIRKHIPDAVAGEHQEVPFLREFIDRDFGQSWNKAKAMVSLDFPLSATIFSDDVFIRYRGRLS